MEHESHWRTLEFAGSVQANLHARQGQGAPTELEREVSESALAAAKTAAEQLKDTPEFQERTRELGERVLAQDADLLDFTRRTEGFTDGVYPDIEEAIAARRERLKADAPVVGFTAIELGLRSLGVSTYGRIQAFLRGESLAKEPTPVEVQLEGDEYIVLTGNDQERRVHAARTGTGFQAGKWGTRGLGAARSELTKWTLDTLLAQPGADLPIQALQEKIQERFGRKPTSDELSEITDWWRLQVYIPMGGERQGLILSEGQGRTKTLRLNPELIVRLSEPPEATSSSGV
jgi:hypothetical protein